MKAHHLDGIFTSPCFSNVRIASQPYYIVAPGYSHKSSGIRALHGLCSLLNQLGYEAYVESPSTDGTLWTPQLTDTVRSAHFLAKKKPIVVYPEVVTGQPLGIGLPVRYVLNYPGLLGGDKSFAGNETIFCYAKTYYPEGCELFIPLLDVERIDAARTRYKGKRSGIAFYFNRLLGAGGVVDDFGDDAVEISSRVPRGYDEMLDILCRVEILYCYESSAIALEALLCGCPVVFLPNPQMLAQFPQVMVDAGFGDIGWGRDSTELEKAQRLARRARQAYEAVHAKWKVQLAGFIETTQAAAERLTVEQAWPQQTVDKLVQITRNLSELAARADRRKYHRMSTQFVRWQERCTVREIDAEIYADHLSSMHAAAIDLVIDHRASTADDLADTLDSLGAALGEPASVTIYGDTPAPPALAETAIRWINSAAGEVLQPAGSAQWVLVLRAGVRLQPQALMEFSLAPRTWPHAAMVYADEAYPDGELLRPHFKPDANLELLRCTNYLGSAVMVQRDVWIQAQSPTSGAALYAMALQLLTAAPKTVLAHIDTILSTAPLRLEPAQEAREFDVAKTHARVLDKATVVRPLERVGTWLVEYALPANAKHTVSLVVPSGTQTGYLRSLLDSLERYPQSALHQVVVVCQSMHRLEVENALCGSPLMTQLRIVEQNGSVYSHASALNAGIGAATGDWVLVADDDTEVVHSGWLDSLLAVALQPDVGCAGPRLVSGASGDDVRIVGGPLILGVNGAAAPYLGEEGRLGETGVYSRLQLNQDVSAVMGSFLLVRKSDWAAVQGFDEERFSLMHTVHDFCLRLGQLGKRHVWTPLVSVAHHGGRTMDVLLRTPRSNLWLADQELKEREALLENWAAVLARDPNYNRHLSLFVPHDVEADIVIDWQPDRRDRPRALALPLRSGAGQYRVVDPLNALQDAGMAQSAVVYPLANGASRLLQPLELVRAQPDCLVLQHSVDDGQLAQIDLYKKAAPDIPIVQMVDDLLGEVPEKHPNRQFQIREGHQRMMQALLRSDRLVVTTQPLKDHYSRYVGAVHIVPNTITHAWRDLVRPHQPRARLRVGWVGAAQHRGDLDLVEKVVAALAPEVDWVFMGMATDGIRPYLKEFHSFVSIADYPKKMASLDLDIAIAPLEDNRFNACKSNLRLLEYGAMGWPVICSDVYPYRTDDPPVIRCGNDPQEWMAAIQNLLQDSQLRRSMGERLHAWVYRNYLTENRVKEWMQAIFAQPETVTQVPTPALE